MRFVKRKDAIVHESRFLKLKKKGNVHRKGEIVMLGFGYQFWATLY